MPFLQLDLNGHYAVADKRHLAARMIETYAEIMSVDARRISVAIRELGEGGVWRVTDVGTDPVHCRPVISPTTSAGYDPLFHSSRTVSS